MVAQIYLVAPPARGRISGGYLYNQRMADNHERVHLVSLATTELHRQLRQLTLNSADCVLVDSLFLNQKSLQPFLELRRKHSCRLGLLLHAFPSLVQAAQARGKRARPLLAPNTMELSLLEELDLVICPGPHLPRLLTRLGARVPMVVCPPGTPARAGASQRPPEATPVQLLSVANLTRGKGLQDGLMALSKLSHLEWQWELVGSRDSDPEFSAELEQRASSLGLSSRIRFVGQLDHTETLQRYETSQLFLLPSYSENQPLVLLEAQAHALPVVAYDSGGIPDIVQHQKNGLLAPVFETEALRRCLQRLLESAELRQQYATAARAAANMRPAWDEAAMLLARLVS